MTLIRFSLIALLLCCTGCSLAPNYERPVAPVAESWPAGDISPPVKEQPEPSAAEIPWRSFFVGAQLQELISQALENNRDLRIAVLNIERFRAQYRIERSGLFPNIDATAGGSGQRLAKKLSGTGEPETVHQYSANLGVSAYELDLFGRVRSLEDQALQQYLATEQARRSVQISLISEVAVAYLTLAADRERLQLAKETLNSQNTAFELVKHRFDSGVASALDLKQAQISVDAAKVDIARLITLVAQDVNNLTLIVGAPLDAELLPGALDVEFTTLQDLSPGLPSTVLLTRPDILQAEHRLQAANANIGAARAAFFPRIVLTTSVGTGSDELSGLFQSGSTTWLFSPQISLPIFDAGSNRAKLKVAEADRDIALAQYDKAIQTAFKEVADALAQRSTIDDQLAAQKSLKDASAESYHLSQARYQKGIDSHLNVLVFERAFYNSQQNLIETRLSQLTNRVTLYKVMGGGATD